MKRITNFFHRAVLMLLALCTCGIAAANPKEGIVSYNLDGAKFYLIADSIGPRNMSIFKGADPALLQKYYPQGSYTGAVSVYVLKTAKFNILFDTGFGQREGSPGGKMFAALPSTGLKPEDIDTIMLTHTHQDHVGGLLQEGRAAFPNATIFICRQEDEFWQNSQPKMRDDVYAAYGGRVALFEAGDKIVQGVSSIAAFGHTPGHTAFLIKDRVLIAGDFLHATVLQLAQPEVCPVYDMDREKSVASRRMLLDLAADKSYLITGMHMTFPTLGKVKKSGHGYAVDNVKL